MPTPAETAQSTLKTGKKRIIDQRFRIERQRKLIGELERDVHTGFVADAVRKLTKMEETLGQMEADYAAAQERLALATVVDEPSTAKDDRNRPM